MATLRVTVEIDVDDALVRNLPAARENLANYTKNAIQNRLFGQGFMPDDVEIDEWRVKSAWFRRDLLPIGKSGTQKAVYERIA